MRSPPGKRLFIALLPSADEQKQWAALVPPNISGRPVPAVNLHTTLAFLGQSTRHQEARYRQIVADLRFDPLTLTLNRFGVWKTPKILWLGSEQTPGALLDLVANLNRKLAETGFTPDPRPFSLHVTLVRHYTGPTPEFTHPPLLWHTHTVALMESYSTPSGVRYRKTGGS